MYSLHDLGQNLWPLNINNVGDILGTPGDETYLMVVRLANGNVIAPPEGIVYRKGSPTGLSDNGYALVLRETTSERDEYFDNVLFHAATGSLQEITVSGDGGPIGATAIDRYGNVCGYQIFGDTVIVTKGFLWELATQVTTYLDAATKFEPSVPRYPYLLGRNAYGHAVGYQAYYENNGAPPSFEVPIYYNGTEVIELPAFAAPSFVGSCRFITDGDVMTIGYDNGATNGLYSPNTGFRTLPISQYIAGMNNSQSILWSSGAGVSYLTDTGGTTTPVDELFPPGSGWSQSVGTAINDKGQIAGTAMHKGAVHGFVLTPITTPRPTILQIPPNVRTRPVINPVVWGQLNAPSRSIQIATRGKEAQSE